MTGTVEFKRIKICPNRQQFKCQRKECDELLEKITRRGSGSRPQGQDKQGQNGQPALSSMFISKLSWVSVTKKALHIYLLRKNWK